MSRVIVALNVGCDDRGTYYVSDEKQQGVHGALLVIDVKNSTSYYGDSLGWSVPSNLADTIGSNLKRIEEDLGINITTTLENVIDMNSDASNTRSESCKLFYPLQSCSHVCGVIVVCMAAVLCDHWDSWLRCDNQMGGILSNPSTNSMQLRLIVLFWIANDNVTATHLVPQRQISSHKDMLDDSCIGYKADACINNTKVAMEHAKQVTVYADSDDDFMPTKCSTPIKRD